MGQARPHKGLKVLLEAYHHSHAPAAGVRLVCVGRDFATGSPAARLINDRLGDHGVILGSVSNDTLRGLYAHAKSLVHLAEHEGFGFTPLEALAAGARVLASDIPVLRETLGEHALFADPANPDAVADAINHLLASPDDPVQRRGRTRWALHYRWSRHARDVLAIYRAVAA